MNIVAYTEGETRKVGFLVWTKIYELKMVDPNLPATREEMELKWKRLEAKLRNTYLALSNNNIKYPLSPVAVTDVIAPELIDITLLGS